MRKLLPLLLALVIALIPATLFAQDSDEPVVFCGDLDDAQCEILTEAARLGEEQTSGSYDSLITMLLSGIPEAPFDEIDVVWNQIGAYVMDPDFAAEMNGMEDEEIMAMMGDPEQSFALLMDLFDMTDMAHETNIVLGQETADLLSANIGYPIPTEISVRYVVVGGNGYVNLDDLAEFIPELSGYSGWIGTELRPVLEYVMENADMEAAGEDEMAQMQMFGGMFMPKASMEIFGDYMDIEQIEEEPAVFHTTFDLPGFVTSPMFMDLVVAAVEASGESINPGDLAQVQTMLPMVAPMIFSGLDVSTDLVIDTDTGYATESASTFEWDLSGLISMAAMAGIPAGPAGVDSMVVFNTENLYGDFNAIDAVEAPENALLVPGETVVDMIEASAE
ncbi:MAG: hypothetical protein KDD92_04945 [Caldilineaceae bacterium]|nr:hypothetical protein [Caldilineaceae bacterium]